MSNQTGFAIGEIVSWSSSANGTTKEKRGKVVAIVDGKEKNDGTRLSFVLPSYGQYNLNNVPQFLWRLGESYIIAVESDASPRDYKRKPKLYWPRTSQLRKVDSDE